MKFDEIARQAHLDPDAFHRDYLVPNKPVLLTRTASQWPAIGKWTPDYIGREFGGRTVKVYDQRFVDAGNSYMSHSQVMRLADYIDVMLSGNSDLRMFLYNIQREIPEMVADIIKPDLLPGLSRQFVFMFLGCRGAVTQMHFDIDLAHVLHTAIHGRKTIYLFPHGESKHLYRHPFTCRSYVDVAKPDYNSFPLLEQARGYRTTLEAGETLFIPSGYWHHIVYDEPGISISLRSHAGCWRSRVTGLYNLLVMQSIDRLMNRLLGQRWFGWKVARLHSEVQ